MKTKYVYYALCSLLLLAAGIQKATGQEPPSLETYSLKNGLKIYFMNYGQIDAVNISLVINSGKKNEVPGQQGFNNLVAELVLKGNKKYTEDEQNNKAFAVGSDIESRVSFDYTTLTANCRNTDTEIMFDLMSSAVREPLFKKETISQYLSYLTSYNTPSKMDVSKQAAVYSALVVHGNENPLGRSIKKDQLARITEEQVKTFHQFNYTPGNTRIIVCGKFDPQVIKQQVETYFGNWQSVYGEVNGVALEKPEIKKREVYFVNRANATQCALLWTKTAPSEKDKDAMAFYTANRIFNLILFREIREKGGKTYSIGSAYNTSRFSNLFQISCSVRASEMLNTVNLFDKTLADFSKAEFSKQGFDNTIIKIKTEVLNNQYPEEVAGFYNPVVYDFNDRKNFLAKLEKLTQEDVQKVIRKYFTPNVYKLVVSGNEQLVNEQLISISGLQKLSPANLESAPTGR